MPVIFLQSALDGRQEYISRCGGQKDARSPARWQREQRDEGFWVLTRQEPGEELVDEGEAAAARWKRPVP